MKDCINKIRRTLNDNSKAELKTLLVIYFAGHGVMFKNQNNIVLLESEKKNQLY